MAIRQWFAPGRINLVGEHLDYNGGPVLPIAIERGVRVKARARTDSTVCVWTTLNHDQGTFDVSVARGEVDGWLAYVAGVFWALAEVGHRVPGFDLVIEADVPAGAGLASSAALECAIASAVNEMAALGLTGTEVATIANRAEVEFVAVPCGPMDQLVSVGATAGHAQFIECAPERSKHVPADWHAAGLSLVLIDTGGRRSLNDGRYATRRDECAEAAKSLGLTELAKAGPDAVLRLDDGILKARARHVITETARTRGAVKAMATGAWQQFGAILTASHESLRDDFDVSCLELDLAVETAMGAGALGARMTGAGFAGCAIALVPAEGVEAVNEQLAAAFTDAQRPLPHSFVARPSAGCHEITRDA